MTTAVEDIRRIRMIQRELAWIADLKASIMAFDGMVITMAKDMQPFIQPTRSPEAQNLLDRIDKFAQEVIIDSLGIPQDLWAGRSSQLPPPA